MYRFLFPSPLSRVQILVPSVVPLQALYCPLPSPTTNPFTDSPQIYPAASHKLTEVSEALRSVSFVVSLKRRCLSRFLTSPNRPTWGLQGIIYPLKVKIENRRK